MLQLETRPGDTRRVATRFTVEEKLRVALSGPLAAMAAPGGGEVQLVATAAWLPTVGVDATLWRPWEDPLAELDCLHLFGSAPEHLPLVRAAKTLNIPVVLSTIAWFDQASRWHTTTGVWNKFKACAGLWVRERMPSFPSWRKQLYQEVNLLLPNSKAEGEQLRRYFQVDPQKIHVVPNGADRRFADPEPGPLPGGVPQSGFVLYPGRIEPRKNQLGFLQAMHGSGVPVVVVGGAVPGHLEYAKACRAAADGDTVFLPRVAHDDPMLESLYAACGAVAMCSWFETPGLVALEAAMSGVPLVLPVTGSAREYFGSHAEYVHPRDRRGILAAVQTALARERSSELARRVRRQFSWGAVATRTREAYERLV